MRILELAVMMVGVFTVCAGLVARMDGFDGQKRSMGVGLAVAGALVAAAGALALLFIPASWEL